MKIRTGFVSNSSSSSFIIGLAVDKDKKYGVPVAVKDGIMSSPDITFDYRFNIKPVSNNEVQLTITSFREDIISINIKDGDNLIYLDDCGPDNDSFFFDGYKMDYDKIEINDFDESSQFTYNLILKLGGKAIYGAGRED